MSGLLILPAHRLDWFICAPTLREVTAHIDGFFVSQACCAAQGRPAMIFGQTARVRDPPRLRLHTSSTPQSLEDLLSCQSRSLQPIKIVWLHFWLQ